MANETKQKAPRRYEKMRDSGVEWIGTVPEHWQVRPVKAYYKIVTGFTPPSKQDDLYDDNGEIWVTISDMVTPIIKKSKQHITVDYALTHIKEKVPKGSLLYSFKLSVGNVAIAGTELYTNEAIASFIPSDTISIPFLKYSSSLIVGNAVQNIYGAAIMNQQRILNAPIVFPPLSEQNIIAEYLEKKCKDIDIVIAEAKASIEEYKAWKSSIIYEAVTKGLDPTAEMKDSGVDIIGTIPAHWKSSRLKFLCSIMTGNQDTQNAVPDGEYPFYVRSPIVERSNVYTFDGEGILMAGDGAGAGRVFHHAFGKYAIHQRVYCFYNFRETVSDYLFFYMSELFSKEMDKGSAQSTVPSVRMPMITNFVVCLPPISEQNEIVSYLKKRIDSIESIIQAKEELIADLESYKKSLIYEVVTGKRKVV